MAQTDDRTWIPRLNGSERESAIKDLQSLLFRAMVRFDVSNEDKEDFVQTATISVLTKLDTFQGRSKFSTWATTIGVNTALSELRKRHWSNVSIEEVGEMEGSEHYGNKDNPEVGLQRQWALELVDSLIRNELTDKQRTALMAELSGMPLQEIATRMNVTRGAIYKLTFDARKKLIQCLKERDLNLTDLVSAME